MRELFEAVDSEEFIINTPFWHNCRILIDHFRRQSEVIEFRHAINAGKIGVKDVESWVAESEVDFVQGVRSRHDYAYAAIAVAIADSNNAALMLDYLIDLSRVHLSEMSISVQVARRLLVDTIVANSPS